MVKIEKGWDIPLLEVNSGNYIEEVKFKRGTVLICAPANNGKQLTQHLVRSRDSINKKSERHGQWREQGISYSLVPTSVGDLSNRKQTQ